MYVAGRWGRDVCVLGPYAERIPTAASIDTWRQLDFCCKISTVSLFAVECTKNNCLGSKESWKCR